MGWEGGIAAIAVSVALASCGSGGSTADPVQDHVCGEIGAICDQTSITLQAPNDAWASGTYTLALNMDGTPAQCSVQIPDPPPTNGLQGNCTRKFSAHFPFAHRRLLPAGRVHERCVWRQLHPDSWSLSDEPGHCRHAGASRRGSHGRRDRADKRDHRADTDDDAAQRRRLRDLHQCVGNAVDCGRLIVGTAPPPSTSETTTAWKNHSRKTAAHERSARTAPKTSTIVQCSITRSSLSRWKLTPRSVTRRPVGSTPANGPTCVPFNVQRQAMA